MNLPRGRSGDRGYPTSLSGEEGAATITACLALAGLIVLTVMVTQLGAVVVARHRAQAAADLAALAAAGALDEGAEAGCAEAESLGRRMGVRVTGCEVSGWDAVVTVEQKLPAGPLGTHSVRAIARAGPVEEDGA